MIIMLTGVKELVYTGNVTRTQLPRTQAYLCMEKASTRAGVSSAYTETLDTCADSELTGCLFCSTVTRIHWLLAFMLRV